MPAFTPNLNMYLAGGGSLGIGGADEQADIDKLNQNFQKIDEFAANTVTSLNKAFRYRGILADRGTIVPSPVEGDEFRATDTDHLYVYDGTKWLFAPGQVLASMVHTANVTGAAGAIVGTKISTPDMEIGQKLKVTATLSQYATNVGPSSINMRTRNHASDVTNTTFDTVRTSRGYSTGGGAVNDSAHLVNLLTTTVAAKVSAALYLGTATSAAYGADTILLMIESA